MPKRLLVTGSSGLIGSEVCRFFSSQGFEIHGLDNNSRAAFLGPEADTRQTQAELTATLPGFKHYEIDLRDREAVLKFVLEVKPYGIVHTAAQPSHDRAAAMPFEDFDTNAVGTLNLLEGVRRFAPDSPFIHLSTNKVYGDRPNTIPMREAGMRWEFSQPGYELGINEDFPIDNSTHTLMGASKVAADVLVQEYGRYFHMRTCCLRAGCVAGPGQNGVALHGFLGYLVKCNLESKEYKILGYKGKQVRDIIHVGDVARFIHEFYEEPRIGEVYNVGGGRDNSCSILEAIRLVEKCSGKPMRHVYLEKNRVGDHICYYSDTRRMRTHYPRWEITKSLEQIISELVESQKSRQQPS